MHVTWPSVSSRCGGSVSSAPTTRPEYDEALGRHSSGSSMSWRIGTNRRPAVWRKAWTISLTCASPSERMYGRDCRRSAEDATNGLESINALIEERCAKVDHWQRLKSTPALARLTALLDIEPRLRTGDGLPAPAQGLRDALKRDLEDRHDDIEDESRVRQFRSRGAPFQLGMGLTISPRSVSRVDTDHAATDRRQDGASASTNVCRSAPCFAVAHSPSPTMDKTSCCRARDGCTLAGHWDRLAGGAWQMPDWRRESVV